MTSISDLVTLTDSIKDDLKIYIHVCDGGVFEKIEGATVDDPIDELIKICTLIHSNTTKLGIVLKTPFKKEAYNASYEQLKQFIKLFAALVSLISQIKKENKHSTEFVAKLVNSSGQLFNIIEFFVKIISDILKSEPETDNAIESLDKKRLLAVSKIWNQCDDFKNFLFSGELGLLRSQADSNLLLVKDAVLELTDWLENPEPNDDDDPFGLNYSSDEEAGDNEVSAEKSHDLVDTIAYAEKASHQIKLIQILFALASKVSVSLKSKNISLSKHTVEKGHSLQHKIVASIDDIVCSVQMSVDVSELQKLFSALNNLAVELEENLNKMADLANDPKVISLLSSWNEKFTKKLTL